MDHYLATSFHDDLDHLIFSMKHKVVELIAERDVLTKLIHETKLICDNTAAKMKDLDNQIASNSGNLEETSEKRNQLASELVEMWGKLKFYRDQHEVCVEKGVRTTHELNDLLFMKAHVEVAHSTSDS